MLRYIPPKGPLPRLPRPEVRRKLRDELEITQELAARMLGVSTNSFGYWERGLRIPEPDHLRAYYDLLYEWQQAIRE